MSLYTFVNLLFLIAVVLCEKCSQVQQTTMVLPENGFEIYTDYARGKSWIPDDVKLFNPIVYSVAKFPNNIYVYTGVLKSQNPTNYNYKFMFIADRRKRFTRLNKRKPIYRALDMTEQVIFKKDLIKFKLKYDECEYYLYMRERKVIRHGRLL